MDSPGAPQSPLECSSRADAMAKGLEKGIWKVRIQEFSEIWNIFHVFPRRRFGQGFKENVRIVCVTSSPYSRKAGPMSNKA